MEDCQICTFESQSHNRKIIIQRALYNKYSYSQDYFHIKQVRRYIGSNQNSKHIVLKDLGTLYEDDEYLKKIYQMFDKLLQISPRNPQNILQAILFQFHDKQRRVNYYKVKKMLWIDQGNEGPLKITTTITSDLEQSKLNSEEMQYKESKFLRTKIFYENSLQFYYDQLKDFSNLDLDFVEQQDDFLQEKDTINDILKSQQSNRNSLLAKSNHFKQENYIINNSSKQNNDIYNQKLASSRNYLQPRLNQFRAKPILSQRNNKLQNPYKDPIQFQLQTFQRSLSNQQLKKPILNVKVQNQNIQFKRTQSQLQLNNLYSPSMHNLNKNFTQTNDQIYQSQQKLETINNKKTLNINLQTLNPPKIKMLKNKQSFPKQSLLSSNDKIILNNILKVKTKLQKL